MPGVLLIRTGYKRKKMGADAWLQKMVNVSDYPESIVWDFAPQVPQQDSFWFDLTGKSVNVAIFSNHNTYIITEASQGEAGQLIAMLTEKHPEIDTADGRIISDKEYDKMRMGAK